MRGNASTRQRDSFLSARRRNCHFAKGIIDWIWKTEEILFFQVTLNFCISKGGGFNGYGAGLIAPAKVRPHSTYNTAPLIYNVPVFLRKNLYIKPSRRPLQHVKLTQYISGSCCGHHIFMDVLSQLNLSVFFFPPWWSYKRARGIMSIIYLSCMYKTRDDDKLACTSTCVLGNKENRKLYKTHYYEGPLFYFMDITYHQSIKNALSGYFCGLSS